MFEIHQLGQLPNADPASWGAYISGLRDTVSTAKSMAVAAYNTLKSTRSNLGLPFITAAAGEGSADTGGWSTDLDQQAVDLMAMATLLQAAADDVLSGKRKLMWDDQIKNFAIEGFSSDLLRLQGNANGVPILVDAQGNQQHVTGQVGVAPVIVFGVVIALAVVSSIAWFLVIKQALETLAILAEQKTQRTLAEAAKKHADLVTQGKATPEQAEQLNKSVYGGATELQKAQAESKKSETEEWPKTLRTLGYIALGVGILYAIVRLVPSPTGRTALASP